MEILKIISNSNDDTIKVSKKLAKYLQKGDIVLLIGELGTRKNQVY